MLRRLLEITKFVRERNQSVRDKLVVQNTVREMEQYEQKWLQNSQRMDTNRIPKQALKNKPKGSWNTGSLRKLHLVG